MQSASPALPGGDTVPRSTTIRALVESPWLLGFVLVLGMTALCRQYGSSDSFGYDEAYLLLNVSRHSFAELIGLPQPMAPAPPLFLGILRGLYLLAGPAEWAMRLPALLPSLAALGLMVPLARQCVSRGGWLWAVGLCAASNHVLCHACQAKPYAVDLCVAATILLAAACYLAPAVSPRTRAWCLAALWTVAALAPWLSFPSVFVLGGASLAMLLDAFRRRTRRLWVNWAGFSALQVLSFAALWACVAQHHNTADQRN